MASIPKSLSLVGLGTEFDQTSKEQIIPIQNKFNEVGKKAEAAHFISWSKYNLDPPDLIKSNRAKELLQAHFIVSTLRKVPKYKLVKSNCELGK